MGLTGIKSDVNSAFLLEALREDLCPCFFQVLQATHILRLVALYNLQIQQWLIKYFSYHIILILTLLPPSHVRTLVLHWVHSDDPGKAQLTNNHNAIHHLKSPLPCNVFIDSGDQEIDIFGRHLFCLPDCIFSLQRFGLFQK